MGIIVLPPAAVGIGSGDSGAAIPGSDLSVPGGVDSTWEFNGLLMNYRPWLDTIQITDIDGLSDADVRDTRSPNPQAHGETAFNAFYGGRTITLTGRVRAQSWKKMRDMEQALRSAFIDLAEMPLVIRQGNLGPDVQIFCRKVQPLVIKETQGDFRFQRDWNVALRAANPRFLSRLEVYSPLVMTASPSNYSITNKGNFNAQPRIQISGPITNPVVRNNTTNQTMTFNAAIAAGDTWTIDISKRTIKDSNGDNQFRYLDVTSDWIELISGDNIIQISGSGITAGSTGLFIYHYETWM